MTEEEVAKFIGAAMSLRRYICIPNVTMSVRGKGTYEADLLVIPLHTRYVHEIEIKVSIQDFRADFEKKIYHEHPHVAMLSYAFPEELYREHEEEIAKAIGKDVGIKVVRKCGDVYTVKNARRRKGAQQIRHDVLKDYMRIGCMKWCRDVRRPMWG